MLSDVEGFEWDSGNQLKNWDKHEVTAGEAEEIFFEVPLILMGDDKHSGSEARYAALGITMDGRLLTVVFTVRKRRIRVISARDMSRRERRIYEKGN